MFLLLLERETDEHINSESDRERSAGEKVWKRVSKEDRRKINCSSTAFSTIPVQFLSTSPLSFIIGTLQLSTTPQQRKEAQNSFRVKSLHRGQKQPLCAAYVVPREMPTWYPERCLRGTRRDAYVVPGEMPKKGHLVNGDRTTHGCASLLTHTVKLPNLVGLQVEHVWWSGIYTWRKKSMLLYLSNKNLTG